MKVYILYRPNSEHERTVTDFVRDFTQRTQDEIELISLDTREGSDKARLYDVVQYPAVFAVDDTGSLQKLWQGDMPLINELSYFTHDQFPVQFYLLTTHVNHLISQRLSAANPALLEWYEKKFGY